jgi:hypothetical protein
MLGKRGSKGENNIIIGYDRNSVSGCGLDSTGSVVVSYEASNELSSLIIYDELLKQVVYCRLL